MATKFCPSCNAEVPAAAQRCKHCFHDFEAEGVEARKRSGMVGLLIFVLVLLLIGIGTAAWLAGTQRSERVVVDAETKSVVFTKTTAAGTQTERVSWEHIERLEHLIGGGDAMYQIVAVMDDGKMRVLKQSEEEDLSGEAKHMAKVVGKPFSEVNKVPGFGEKNKAE